MSIVEKALQKAQLKTERAAAQDAVTPLEPIHAPAEHPAPERAVQSATTDAAAPRARVARGGTVALDFVQLRQDGRLPPESLSHQTEEEFRRIKWPLLNAIAHRDGARPADNNILLVTSAIPGEGKTFTALNLALSIARDRDLEVLLVDGDVAQPSLTGSLGLTGRPGITNLLRDTSMQLEDVVYATNIPRLEVLPAGARQDNAPELLASARMAVVVAQLCARASPGVVIIDSPPVLATNEAQVMTRYAGQVLMVVRADSTEQRVLAEALSLIDRARPVSAVLNRVEPSLVSRYYSHYYYGYGKSPPHVTQRGVRYLALAGTIAAILLQGTAAVADPYEYDLRSKFVREDERELLPPGLDLEPRIGSALLFVGNINLAEDSDDEINVAGIEAAPGIYASYRSNRADANLDYTLIGRAFEDEDYDSVSHLLNARGNYTLMPDLLFVTGQAGYSDSIVDASRGTNYGGTGLFDRSNIAETGRASITPNLKHLFGGFRLDASYTYGRVWYFESDDAPASDELFTGFQQDSEDQRFLVSFGTTDVENATTLRAFYEWQASDFDVSLPYRYERAGLDTSLRLSRTLRLVADGGVETDLTESTTEGGLDAEFWHAGLLWQPDSRTSVEGRYGERFFGDSYSLEASRTTKWLTLRASYSEDPEVETRRIGVDFDPGSFPIPPSVDFSFLSALPYVRKDAVLTLIVEGARTQVRLDAYDRKREYIRELVPEDQITGVMLNVARDIGADLYGEIELRYDDILRGPGNVFPSGLVQFQAYDRDMMGRVTWEAYVNFSTSVEAGYFARSGDRSYDGEWLALRFRYTF